MAVKKNKCINCGQDTNIRNPSGNCDHLYYPENIPHIAILIPTLGRGARIKGVIDNIATTTQLPYTIYFICEPHDTDTISKIPTDIPYVKMILNTYPHTYVSAINHGYRSTKEPYIFCGSDDIEFTKGWDKEASKYFGKYGFIGVVDSWTITKTGVHASHFFVSREYIQKYSGVFDEKDVIYSSQYQHLNCDIETEQTAMCRGEFVMSKKSIVEHKHWCTQNAQMDQTYMRGMECQGPDGKTYEKRRRNFELYILEDLFRGKVTPTPSGRLTIVLPSYNQVKYLKKTIKSIYTNTYNYFELIIIDDASDQATVEYIKSLTEPNIVKVFNSAQLFVTANWNMGAKLAKNDYVAFLNNDIVLSKYWDVYLCNTLSTQVIVANPFQTDDGELIPYGKSKRTGSIDVRGTCFMMERATLARMGYFPSKLRHWYSDWWLGWIARETKKKTVYIPDSIVHHYGSKSSTEFENKTNRLRYIIEEDRLEFQKITGLDGYLK